MAFTLTQYRAAAAQELGPFETSTATSGSSTSVLECTAALFQSTIDQSQLYKDYYLFRPNAVLASDQVRQVDTYTPATGMLVPDKVWTNSPNGELFELHGIVEPSIKLPAIINDSLKRCTVMSEVSLVAGSKLMRQTLASFAWLTDPRWVRQVGVLLTTESRESVDPFAMRPIHGKATIDAGTIWLNYWPISFNGTETLYLNCERPAYFLCAPAAGVYGAQNGLALEGDICSVDPLWVAAGVLVEAWRRLGHLLEPAANQKLVRDRTESAAWFQYLTGENFDPPGLGLQQIRYGGPPR